MSYLDLEHKTLALFRRENLPKNLIVCVSGGVDSMVLLNVLNQIKGPLKLDLRVAHVHHGFSGPAKLLEFRSEAKGFVKKRCEDLGLLFYSNSELADMTSPGQELSSEGELRKIRETFFKELLASPEFDSSWSLCLGHHRDDLLEGRLIQMIRGCGQKGFLSMGLRGAQRLRPLIQVSRQEVVSYSEARSLAFLEDPSNQSNEPLRNWLRNVWLPELEAKRAGAVRNLGGSLDNLALDLSSEDSTEEFDQLWLKIFDPVHSALNLGPLVGGDPHVLSKSIAKYLRTLKIENFSQNHIKEIIKRIDNPKKVNIFTTCQREWRIEGLIFKRNDQ